MRDILHKDDKNSVFATIILKEFDFEFWLRVFLYQYFFFYLGAFGWKILTLFNPKKALPPQIERFVSPWWNIGGLGEK
jgi:hypothetical protein